MLNAVCLFSRKVFLRVEGKQLLSFLDNCRLENLWYETKRIAPRKMLVKDFSDRKHMHIYINYTQILAKS